MTFLIILYLFMAAYIIKAIVDINTIMLRMRKNTILITHKNEKDKNYQFIKGLY